MPPRRRNFNILPESQTTINVEDLRRSPRLLERRIAATNAEILRQTIDQYPSPLDGSHVLPWSDQRSEDMERDDDDVPEDAYLEDLEEDTHADMRLDIEHMSHEELVAVGENIGDAEEAGLNRETILAILGRHRYRPPKSGSPDDKERCCICQEDYVEGELIGELDCAHLFHHDCIEQWLLHKNACPLCKKLAMHPVDFWGYPLE